MCGAGGAVVLAEAADCAAGDGLTAAVKERDPALNALLGDDDEGADDVACGASLNKEKHETRPSQTRRARDEMTHHFRAHFVVYTVVWGRRGGTCAR